MRFERVGGVACRVIIAGLRAERGDPPLPAPVERRPLYFSDDTVQTLIVVTIGVLMVLAVGGLAALLTGLGDPR